MFKITELVLRSFDNQEYSYFFSGGINYFQGANDTGKTEFYNFIDYMFGSNANIKSLDWYKDSLKSASVTLLFNAKLYILTRTCDPEINYLSTEGDAETERLSLGEYKDKLNEIFSCDEVSLRKLRDFVEENLTYRAFTMFNFLGENGQGLTRDFLDKCRDIKYSIKLESILNYIFNDNLIEIIETKNRIDDLKKQIKMLESKNEKYVFIQNQVNSNLLKLNSRTVYNGHNGDEVLAELSKIINLKTEESPINHRSVSGLEVIFSNLSEQIKVYDNTIKNYLQIERENDNRKRLLSNLNELMLNSPEMNYIIEPLREMINDLDESVSFSKYVISDETIDELKKQRDKVLLEIKKQDSNFRLFSYEEKSKAVALIQAYLDESEDDVTPELNEKRNELIELNNKLKGLIKSDNSQKINEMSRIVTQLYKNGLDKSNIIRSDCERENFEIKYIKRGNILQPIENGKVKTENIYLGSMARHTLIQLSGYLAFMLMIIEGNKCPIIPMLVFDHLSKPFSDDNSSAVGAIINGFYEMISKEEVQIFMFDDEEPALLGIDADHYELLSDEKKTGFCPFYNPNNTH